MEPFIGEIRMFAGDFAPLGWEFCEGQLLAISGNDALFNLLGTTYGGDGRTNFALPDLRGRIPLHPGSGSGPCLTPRSLGARGGAETVHLTVNQMPTHKHSSASTNTATLGDPGGNVFGDTGSTLIHGTGSPMEDMDPNTNATVGGDQAHNNVMPVLGINFMIALFGNFPSQN